MHRHSKLYVYLYLSGFKVLYNVPSCKRPFVNSAEPIGQLAKLARLVIEHWTLCCFRLTLPSIHVAICTNICHCTCSNGMLTLSRSRAQSNCALAYKCVFVESSLTTPYGIVTDYIRRVKTICDIHVFRSGILINVLLRTWPTLLSLISPTQYTARPHLNYVIMMKHLDSFQA